MITTILRSATRRDLEAAYFWTAEQLHIPYGELTDVAAVAYVVRHFQQGAYSGWDGFVAMREADA